jgi:hypothetical protein
VPAGAEIVHEAGTGVEIVVAVGVLVAVDVVAGAVDDRAAVVVEIAGVAGVLAAGAAAAGGTKSRCHDFVATDFHGSTRINQRELNQKS